MTEPTSPLHDPASTGSTSSRSASTMEAREPVRLTLPNWRPNIHLGALTGATWIVIGTLIAIVLVGGFLRLTHGNWDHKVGETGVSSGHLHPDERFLTQISNDTRWSGLGSYFDTDTSGLNPYNITKPDGSRQPTYVYGTLPLFANKLTASYAGTPYRTLERVGLGDPVNSVLSTVSGGRIGLPEHNFNSYDFYTDSGRWLSAMVDILTIIVIFFLAKQLANKNVGLLAAGLYAFTPFAIQNSHFYIVDPFVALFGASTLYFGVTGAKHGGYHNFVLAGVSAGLATACKTTAVALLPVVVLGVGIHAWPGIMPYLAPLWAGDTPEYAARRDGRRLDQSVLLLVLGSLAALLAAFLAYRFTMPYAFKEPSIGDFLTPKFGHIGPIPIIYPDIMNPQWIDDIADQQRLLDGAAFPPNVQWVGRSRWLWPLQQMVVWGMGPALGITAWIGVAFAGVWAWRKREAAWLIPLAWVVGYFFVMGGQFSLYMRYFLPLYPALVVFAAFVMYQAWIWASSGEPFAALGRLGERLAPIKPAVPVVVRAGVVTVCVFTVLAGLAFFNIYRSDVTRMEASCWFYANVPEGSVVGHEAWDDDVPSGQPGCEQKTYEHVTFDNFGNDSPEKVEKLLSTIDQVDYVALSSARLSGTIPRVPAVYPVTTRYYEALESGELGFEKVAEFTSYPRIFGREFDDTGAEESFSVYDHPKVTFYKKTDEYSANRAREVLGADAFIAACTALPKEQPQNCLLYREDVLAEQKAGGTWGDIFEPNSLVNRFPAFFFLLTMELAAFALIPLALIVFQGLPDRGYLLTKPLGIIGLAYLVYAPSGLGALDFTRGTIAGMLALMLLAGGIFGCLWRTEIIGWFREHWRFALACEAIFLGAFLFSYWIRLQNPDLYHPFTGGEKPMDFAYFNGVLRTTDLTQGPVDPWYAGGYLNYYWWGFFIGATPIKLLGIVPEVAYNLVVPMFFALSAAATFSVAYNLTEGTRRLMRRGPGAVHIGASGPIIAGLLAIFFVMIAGNISAFDYLHRRFETASPIQTDIPVLGAFLETFGGLYESLAPTWSWLPAFIRGNDGPGGSHSFTTLVLGETGQRGYDWWGPSRALGILPNEENQVQPITEFPFWTYLFADLHAHLMAIPFAMAATGVALGAVMNFTRLNPLKTEEGRHRSMEFASWAMVVVLAVIVGALRWINSWDYPPFLIIASIGLILGERAKEGRWTLRCVSMGVLKAAIMGALSFLLFSVVARNYSQSYSSINQADQTTDLSDYLSHFGVFLFIMTGFLVIQLYRAITREKYLNWVFFTRSRKREPIEAALVVAVLLLGASVLVWQFAQQRWGVTGLALVGLITLVLVSIHEMRSHTPSSPIMLFIYAMMALGFGLCGGVEMITLEGDVGRMNTVFKFYLHVWMLWGVVTAFALWYIFGVLRPQEAFLKRSGEANAALVRVPRYAFAIVAIVLLSLTLVYPYFGLRSRINERFDASLGSGNNGFAWMESQNIREGGHDNLYVTDYQATGVTGEHEMKYTLDAINWVRENIDGTPTTIEAVGPSYRSLGSRFAINTGLPTVHGWGFHQSQQRVKFAQSLQLRQADVGEFYTTEDVGRARQLLDKYDVGVVFVGDEEEFNYGEAGMAKFEDGLGGALELLYENPSVSVYRVIPDGERTTENAVAQ